MNQPTLAEATKYVLRFWNLEAKVKQLAGFVDVNFLVESKRQGDFLLKFSLKNDNSFLKAQVAIFRHIDIKIRTVEVEDYLLFLIPWIPGIPWADHEPKRLQLYRDLGRTAAIHYKSIADFRHDSLHRPDFDWDLANSLWIKQDLVLLPDVSRKAVDYFVGRFESHLQTYLQLPKTAIHNDLNDYNILVKDNQVSGFIDYGDMCFSQRINELAILLAYAMMEQEVPLDSAVEVIREFTHEQALTREEIEVLYSLIGMRLSVTLTSAAINLARQPENEYLQISKRPAEKLIAKLMTSGEKWSTYRFLSAAGYDLFTDSLIEEYVATKKTEMVVPLAENDYYTLDLNVASTELGHEMDYGDPFWHEQSITNLLRKHKKSMAIGSYNEVRPLYSSDDFSEEGNEGQRWRTVHLGLDFFQKAGTEVYAFADGCVHALKYNEGDKNYGNTIILQHQGFYTLYGHLSSGIHEQLMVGQEVRAGELIALFGEPHENGGWAPHLHFQIIRDMLHFEGDYPGVCHLSERDVWIALSPDPRKFLGINPHKNDYHGKSEILKKRQEHLGRSYSLSYNEPLHIVRAQGAYLYDSTGRKYLDGVNNVPHVGHQNSRLVEAASAQLRLLNTNTRYLHQNIVDLAEKLASTLPDHLTVCHFVNSGSEANELALRMARIATGKEGVVAMEHGYHGNTGLCVDISSYKFGGKGGGGQKDFVQLVPMPDPLRDQAMETFSLDEGKEVPAAFIHESILSCGGQVVLPQGFFKDLYSRFTRRGLVTIADEVQTGLGRVGTHMWAFEAEGLSPDIVTIGKPFGNGHPLAAVVCTEEIANRFHNGMEYFNTFGGNPVSCAIGLEVLRIIEEDNLQKHALELGQWVKDEFIRLQGKYPIIADVRGRGLFLGWEFAHPETKEARADLADLFVNEMKRFGVLLSTDGPLHNVIKFKPPMVFDYNNAKYMITMAEKVMQYPVFSNYE